MEDNVPKRLTYHKGAGEELQKAIRGACKTISKVREGSWVWLDDCGDNQGGISRKLRGRGAKLSYTFLQNY